MDTRTCFSSARVGLPTGWKRFEATGCLMKKDEGTGKFDVQGVVAFVLLNRSFSQNLMLLF